MLCAHGAHRRRPGREGFLGYLQSSCSLQSSCFLVCLSFADPFTISLQRKRSKAAVCHAGEEAKSPSPVRWLACTRACGQHASGRARQRTISVNPAVMPPPGCTWDVCEIGVMWPKRIFFSPACLDSMCCSKAWMPEKQPLACWLRGHACCFGLSFSCFGFFSR